MPRFVFLVSLFLVLFILPSALSLSCVGISQGNDWDDIQMQKGIPSYFSPRIYNSSAGTGTCEESNYVVELSLENSEFVVDDIFDYNLNPEEVYLKNGQSAQTLITLVPKVSAGKYKVLITARRDSPEGSGTAIISTSSARLVITIGNNPTPNYSEIPFWTVRKDCPGGFVVKEGEPCPIRACRNGTLIYSEDESCPEDTELAPAPEQTGNGEETPGQEHEKAEQEGLSIEMIIAVTAILVACAGLIGSFAYIQKLRGELRGKRL